jgi:hypothetical protein
MIQLKDMFSYLGGNLDSLGGLQPSAKSGKHDSLLRQSASVRIDDMQARTTNAVRRVVESVADYIYYDPAPSDRVYKDIPKSDMSVKIDFDPEIREGDFLDFAIDIAPYSLQSRSPAERLSAINEMMTGIVMPMAEQLKQRGIVPDMDKYMEIVSKYSHMSDRRLRREGNDGGDVRDGRRRSRGRWQAAGYREAIRPRKRKRRRPARPQHDENPYGWRRKPAT